MRAMDVCGEFVYICTVFINTSVVTLLSCTQCIWNIGSGFMYSVHLEHR